MGETDKPFACPMTECGMRFTNEDHLTVHIKKHDMCLNFGNGQKMNIFADQTPTPTRFIRNCEEVGLFQDLQNVNPFEEQFRKAAEAAKSGTTPLHEVEPMCGQPDDTLHTPQVFSHIEHHHQHVVSVTRVAESPPPPPVLQPPTLRTRNEEHFPLENEKVSQQENRQSLQQNSVARDTSVQLLLRLPDGKVVKLSAVEMAETEGTSSASIHSSNLLTAPSVILDHPTNSGETARTVILSSAPRATSPHVIMPTNSRVISTNISSDRMALAKQRLKQALSANRKKDGTENTDKVSVKEGKTLLTLKTRVPERLASVALPPKRTRELSGSTGSSGEDTQVKRQKFLERNRAAATRCRQKRKHWINTLERRADVMHSTNQQLVAEVGALRAEVAQLKTLLLAHRDCSVTKAMCQSGVMHVIETSTLNTTETTLNSVPNFVHASEQVQSVINLATAPSNRVLILQPCSPPVVQKNITKSVKQASVLAQPVRPLAIPITQEPQLETTLPKNCTSQISAASQTSLNCLSHNQMTSSSPLSRSPGVLKFVRNVDKETVIVENVSNKD